MGTAQTTETTEEEEIFPSLPPTPKTAASSLPVFPASVRPYFNTVRPRYRGAVINHFLSPVRRGYTEPTAILADVKSSLESAVANAAARQDQEAVEAYQAALTLTGMFQSSGLLIAEWAAQYGAIPYDELQELKEQAGKAGTSEREQTPPTEKQLHYLRNLGYQGPEPVSMAEAGRLIAEQRGDRR